MFQLENVCFTEPGVHKNKCFSLFQNGCFSRLKTGVLVGQIGCFSCLKTDEVLSLTFIPSTAKSRERILWSSQHENLTHVTLIYLTVRSSVSDESKTGVSGGFKRVFESV